MRITLGALTLLTCVMLMGCEDSSPAQSTSTQPATAQQCGNNPCQVRYNRSSPRRVANNTMGK